MDNIHNCLKQCILTIFSFFIAFEFSLLIIFHIFYLLGFPHASPNASSKYNSFSTHIQTTHLIVSKFPFFFSLSKFPFYFFLATSLLEPTARLLLLGLDVFHTCYIATLLEIPFSSSLCWSETPTRVGVQ